MTEQEQIAKVVEALPEVFGFDSVTIRCRYCLYMVEKKLMTWLEDEERGYTFCRGTHGKWSWCGSRGHAAREANSQWQALYAAFEHWQSQQESKGKTKRERVIEILIPGCPPFSMTLTQEKAVDRIISIFPPLDMQGLRGKIRAMVREVFQSGTIESHQEFAVEQLVDAIMSAVEKHAKVGG